MNILIRLILVILANIVLSPVTLLVGLTYLVTYAAKCVVRAFYSGDPTLELMPGNDAIWADPDQNTRHPYYTVLIFEIKGKINREKIDDMCQFSFEDCKHNYVARNFLRYIVGKFGFYFWKSEEKPCVHDHYKIYDRVLRSEQEVKTLISDLKTTNIADGKGQIFFSIYPVKFDDQQEDKYLLILTTHHSVADGTQASEGVKKYLAEGKFDQTTLQNLLGKLSAIPPWKIYILKLLALFYLPYDILANVFATEDTPFYARNRKLSGKIYTSYTKPIDLTVVKGIKNGLKTQANTLFLATLTQALRKTFRKHKMKCSKGYRLLFPIGTGNLETDSMATGNRIAIVYCTLPMDSDNVPDSIPKIEKQLNNWESSILMFLGEMILSKTVNYLPMWAVQYLLGIYKYSSTLSSFPLVDYSESFGGGEMLNMRFVIPFLTSGSSMTFGVAQNKLRMSICVDQNLVSGQEVVDDITRNVELEFEELAAVLSVNGKSYVNGKS